MSEYVAYVCPTCGAWDGGSVGHRRAPWCDGACSHERREMEPLTLVPAVEVARLQRIVDGVRSKTALGVVAEKMAAEDAQARAEAQIQPLHELLWRWLDQCAAAGLGPRGRLSQDTLDATGMPPEGWTAPQTAPRE